MDHETAIPNPPTDLYVSLFHQAIDALFVVGAGWRIVAVNARACELLGRSTDELVGTALTDHVEPRSPGESLPTLSGLAEGTVLEVECRLRHSGGGAVPIELSLRVLPGGHVLCIGRPPDERSRMLEELQLAHARLEALWSVSTLPQDDPRRVSDRVLETIVRMTHSEYGFYGFVNEDESVMTIHAWSGEAMKDCSLVDRPTEFPVVTSGVWAEAIRQRRPFILNDYAAGHEASRGLPTGHVPLTRLLAVPYFSGGRIVAVAAVANRPRDYTHEDVVQMTSFLQSVEAAAERARAEKALASRKELLDATQRLARVGGWEWDLEKQTMDWTDETYRLHDLEPGGIDAGAGDHIERSSACYPPEARGEVLRAFRLCVGQGVPYDMVVPFTSAQGRAMWIRTRGEAIWRDGRIVKVIGDIMDVTDRKRAEDELTRTTMLLDSLRTAQGAYITGGDPRATFDSLLGTTSFRWVKCAMRATAGFFLHFGRIDCATQIGHGLEDRTCYAVQ